MGKLALVCAGMIAGSIGCTGLASRPSTVEVDARLTTTLITAGREPRMALRFQVQEAVEQSVTLTTVVDELRTTRFAGGPPLAEPRDRRRHEQTWQATVTETRASGDIAFEVSVTEAAWIPGEADEPASAVREMDRIAESTIGRGAALLVSSRGVPRSGSTTLSGGGASFQRQAMEGLEEYLPFVAIPFPEAPVGVGAKWSVSRPIASAELELTYAAVYELVEFDRDRGTGTVRVDVERSAKPRVFESEGGSTRLTRMATTATGTLDFSLDSILPRTMSLEAVTEIFAAIQFPGSRMAAIYLVEATQEAETTTP